MSRSTRRTFLQQSTAFGIGLGMTAGLRGKAFAANDKIQVACIGVRGRGNSVMQSFAAEPDCAITHLCDVNESIRQQRARKSSRRPASCPSW